MGSGGWGWGRDEVMMDEKAYRKLKVWQEAMDLVQAVYTLTTLLPDDERFGLSSQMKRASVSVAANIAEGYGRSHRGDYLRHLSIARGSLMELETHLTLVVRLSQCDREAARPVWRSAQRTGKMLTRLIQSLTAPPRPQTPDPRP
mgnify:CR=1 FL=1